MLKALVSLFVLAAALPLTAVAQTHYKCKTASGGTIFSDAPCPSGTRQEQATYSASQARQYSAQDAYAPAKSSDARMLDSKVAEALGSGDFSRAKGLALTPEHWQMISEAEQRYRQPATGRTDADLRAESKNSPECKSAQRSYENEASSIQKNGAAIGAAKRAMYSACGMTEPTVIENRTVVNRPVVAAPAAQRPMNCQQKMNGQMVCW